MPHCPGQGKSLRISPVLMGVLHAAISSIPQNSWFRENPQNPCWHSALSQMASSGWSTETCLVAAHRGTTSSDSDGDGQPPSAPPLVHFVALGKSLPLKDSQFLPVKWVDNRESPYLILYPWGQMFQNSEALRL